MPDILLACANAERIPLADDSVHVVVTSPPYWQQRDYDLDDAGIGLDLSRKYLVSEAQVRLGLDKLRAYVEGRGKDGSGGLDGLPMFENRG